MLLPITADVDSKLNQSELEANKETSVKRGKTRATKSRVVLVWFPSGCEKGANFANQSYGAVKQMRKCSKNSFENLSNITRKELQNNH